MDVIPVDSPGGLRSDPLTDPLWVDASAQILTGLAREWVAGEDQARRLAVLDLQEALHVLQMQRTGWRAAQAPPDWAVRNGYWVGWSTGPQPVLTDTAEIMQYGTGPQPVLAAEYEEVPDVEPHEPALAGDEGPAVAGEVLDPDPATGDQGDVSEPPGTIP